MFRNPLGNQDGIGLIAALFIIIVVGMFGVLIARYTMISSQSSAEDYLWSQALYAAESTASLRILNADGGGSWAWTTAPTINTFPTTVTAPSLVPSSTSIYEIQAQASRATITRTIQVRYSLN